MLFERLFGMRINFNKNESIPTNLVDDEIHEISHILSCLWGLSLSSTFGVPIHFEKLKREELQPVVNKLIKRVVGWRGGVLAYSSRLVLIVSVNQVLTS
jgi:hypothetical protein